LSEIVLVRLMTVPASPGSKCRPSDKCEEDDCDQSDGDKLPEVSALGLSFVLLDLAVESVDPEFQNPMGGFPLGFVFAEGIRGGRPSATGSCDRGQDGEGEKRYSRKPWALDWLYEFHIW